MSTRFQRSWKLENFTLILLGNRHFWLENSSLGFNMYANEKISPLLKNLLKDSSTIFFLVQSNICCINRGMNTKFHREQDSVAPSAGDLVNTCCWCWSCTEWTEGEPEAPWLSAAPSFSVLGTSGECHGPVGRYSQEWAAAALRSQSTAGNISLDCYDFQLSWS